MSLDGVLMRSRASIDRFRHARDVGDVDAVGRHQPDVGRIRLAVAAEAIAAEREGERGETGVVRRIGEAIDARRQQAGQRCRAGTDRGICWSRPRARTAPARSGRRPPAGSGIAPGLAAKPLASANCRAGAGKPVADRLPCRFGRESDGDGRRGRRGLEYGMHAVSRSSVEGRGDVSHPPRAVEPRPN